MKNNMLLLLHAGWKIHIQRDTPDQYVALLANPYTEQFIPSMISYSAYSWIPAQIGSTPQAAVELLKLKLDLLEGDALVARFMSALGLMLSPAGLLQDTDAKIALGVLGFKSDLHTFGICVDEVYMQIPCEFYPHVIYMDHLNIGDYAMISKKPRPTNVVDLPGGLGIPGLLESHNTFGMFYQDMSNAAIHDVIRGWTPSPAFDALIVTMGESKSVVKDLQPIFSTMGNSDALILTECGELIAHSILPDTRFVEVQLNLQLGK